MYCSPDIELKISRLGHDLAECSLTDTKDAKELLDERFEEAKDIRKKMKGRYKLTTCVIKHDPKKRQHKPSPTIVDLGDTSGYDM